MTKNLKTYTPKALGAPEKKWYLIDATDKVLGRVATKIARVVRGKEKVLYTPSFDVGDYVVVVNAEKIVLTGKKETDKVYYRHSGYPGGLKSETASEVRTKKPEELILKAVKGMLPKNSLGRKMLTKVKVCAGNTHKYQAQKPIKIEF
jgi:large subunit ribosomal protein L13